jgi:hypothetical protein
VIGFANSDEAATTRGDIRAIVATDAVLRRPDAGDTEDDVDETRSRFGVDGALFGRGVVAASQSVSYAKRDVMASQVGSQVVSIEGG